MKIKVVELPADEYSAIINIYNYNLEVMIIYAPYELHEDNEYEVNFLATNFSDNVVTLIDEMYEIKQLKYYTYEISGRYILNGVVDVGFPIKIEYLEDRNDLADCFIHFVIDRLEIEFI